jgi:hypothetical protein
MSMNVSSGSSDAPMCDVNTTPLIDVMLVLLVMLIVTLPIMNHAVKLDMPRPNDNPPPDVPPEVINIEIDFDGTIPAGSRHQDAGFLFQAGSRQGSAAGNPSATGSSGQVRRRCQRDGVSPAAEDGQDGIHERRGVSRIVQPRGWIAPTGALQPPFRYSGSS